MFWRKSGLIFLSQGVRSLSTQCDSVIVLYGGTQQYHKQWMEYYKRYPGIIVVVCDVISCRTAAAVTTYVCVYDIKLHSS